MATHARTATAGALQAPLFMQQQKKCGLGLQHIVSHLYYLLLTLESCMFTSVCARRAHTSTVHFSTVCMTGKSIELFYEVFAGMVIWYFLSGTRG